MMRNRITARSGRHALMAVLALAAAGCQSLPGMNSSPGYGAVAYSPVTQDWHIRWNAVDAQRAAALAMAECGQASCRVLTSFGPKRCGTLALGPRTLGVGVGQSRKEAQEAALAKCTATGKACRVARAECNA